MPRDKTLIQRVFQLMGKPIPPALQKEIADDSPAGEEEVDAFPPENEEVEEEEVEEEEDDFADDDDEVEEEDEEEKGAGVHLDFYSGADKYGPDLLCIASSLQASVPEDDGQEVEAADHPRKAIVGLHVKSYHLKMIYLLDELVGKAIVEISKVVKQSLLPFEKVSGIYVDTLGDVRVAFKSTSLCDQPVQLLNILMSGYHVENTISGKHGEAGAIPKAITDCNSLMEPVIEVLNELNEVGDINTIKFVGTKPKHLMLEHLDNGKWSVFDFSADVGEVGFIAPFFVWTTNAWKDFPVVSFVPDWDDNYVVASLM